MDTSAIVAPPGNADLAGLHDGYGISVITLAELEVGVLIAGNDRARSQRLQVLTGAKAEFEPMAVDEQVAHHYAALVAAARRAGRQPGVVDTIIAATALAHGVPIVTRDRDFLGFADDLEVILIS